MVIAYPINERNVRAVVRTVASARAPGRVPVHRRTAGAGRGGAPMPPEQG
jgi:hypothetical protein